MMRQTMFNFVVLKAEQIEIRRLQVHADAHLEESVLNEPPK